ncbi:MAG TPA: hypothetical protein VN922_12475 [Bacteroidia bacterium]|nr:hypothetical protein [Bacteroidia bacterium]
METDQTGAGPIGASKPRLTPNKAKQALREKISKFLVDNFDEVQEIYKDLEPKEKVKVYCSLLPFGMAKVKPEPDMNLDRLTDEELDEIMERLKEIVHKQLEANET